MIHLLITIEYDGKEHTNLQVMGCSSMSGHTPHEQAAAEALIGFVKQRGNVKQDIKLTKDGAKLSPVKGPGKSAKSDPVGPDAFWQTANGLLKGRR